MAGTLPRPTPDLGLSPWVDDGFTTDYPFAVPPAGNLPLSKVFSLYRDHYEGTEFDLSRGVAAGPYGDPNRNLGHYDGAQNNLSERRLAGAWERPVSVIYQGYTYVAQTRPEAPELTRGILWYGPDVSYTTCFSPFPSKVEDLPRAYQAGDPQKYSRDSAWWAFDFVANWARLNFQRMCTEDIQPLQLRLEAMQLELLAEWDKHFAGAQDRKEITVACEENATEILGHWRDLADRLIAKYSDGYINCAASPPDKPAPNPVGYSAD